MASIENKKMNVDKNQDLEASKARSKARVADFLDSLDPAIDRRDDAIASELANENSSARNKLRKIYALLSDVGVAVAPFVACRKGCSGCCKMNISLTSIEAERLAAASGRLMAHPYRTIFHREDKFAGVPCPFLVDDECSVYEARPYACRAHYSFDVSSYWCQPERAYEGEMAQLELGGAKKAYVDIALRTSIRGFADIRDFFPLD
ncbi:YkgJ family cysteine cluster protein [Variovorax paradoxus]|uniref:YkgJ family cysteine cluster protein n=1 Tax=Variovorax paradoxus TaxID=34073 RepID=UPI003D654D90